MNYTLDALKGELPVRVKAARMAGLGTVRLSIAEAREVAAVLKGIPDAPRTLEDLKEARRG